MFSEETLRSINLNVLAKQKSSCSGSVERHERLHITGVWQSLLINNLSFGYLQTDRHSKFAESYCDKVFDPLSWEAPKWVAGSGSALKNQLYYGVSTFVFATVALLVVISQGLRQTLLSPAAAATVSPRPPTSASPFIDAGLPHTCQPERNYDATFSVSVCNPYSKIAGRSD
jgi:hypothetical protein